MHTYFMSLKIWSLIDLQTLRTFWHWKPLFKYPYQNKLWAQIFRIFLFCFWGPGPRYISFGLKTLYNIKRNWIFCVLEGFGPMRFLWYKGLTTLVRCLSACVCAVIRVRFEPANLSAFALTATMWRRARRCRPVEEETDRQAGVWETRVYIREPTFSLVRASLCAVDTSVTSSLIGP